MIVQNLTGLFPTADHRVRIRTNMNIYWDEVFVSVGAIEAPTRLTVLDPASADLRYRGFSREFRRGGRQGPPWFDYDSVSQSARWRPLAGAFTRFGDVLPLMLEADDRYAIMGPGDELALRFSAAGLPALPDGWTRDFLIYSEGWLKDSDLNTAAGWKVDPLPFHGMTRYPYASDEAYPLPEIVEAWHTRVQPPALKPGEEGATER